MKRNKIKQPQNSLPERERRFVSDCELRVNASGGKQKITGYAAKFDVLSEDLGGFREKIDPHAFDACLRGKPDCRALWNHNPDHVLGRTTAGTLRLWTDSLGLRYEIDPPDTSIANDLTVSLRRGDVNQSSFGFSCIRDAWSQDSGGNAIRTVLQAELFDCSPCTFPAYPDATSGVRALRNCPSDLRAKIEAKRDEDEDGYRPECDPDSDQYDPEACEDDDDEDERCDCRCERCLDDDCVNCTNDECDDEDCDACPMQSRARRRSLLMAMLR